MHLITNVGSDQPITEKYFISQDNKWIWTVKRKHIPEIVTTWVGENLSSTHLSKKQSTSNDTRLIPARQYTGLRNAVTDCYYHKEEKRREETDYPIKLT